MFEHKELDGTQNRLISATEAFVSNEVLECLVGPNAEDGKNNRVQFGVVGDRLVERGLPPSSIGDYWSFDTPATPWWGTVNNPPHAGLVAEYNKHSGGQHRVTLDTEHNVVAFATAGEEVTLVNGDYKVVRESDGAELTAASILELRKLYFA
jgi:hypothetical protein